MTEYLKDPRKSREEQKAEVEKNVQKVVSGTVKTKKKSGVTKLANIFIAEDVSNVKDYIINDVLIPTVRDTLWSVLTNSLDMFIYGGKGKANRTSSSSKISYRQFYENKPSNRYNSANVANGFNYDDIILDNRAEAEKVINQLRDIIDTYTMATVSDLYDLVGLTGPHTANKYGWTNLRNAEAVRVRDGYILKLPRALPIN